MPEAASRLGRSRLNQVLELREYVCSRKKEGTNGEEVEMRRRRRNEGHEADDVVSNLRVVRRKDENEIEAKELQKPLEPIRQG